ncbi:MAG: hypothetical protein AAF333_09545 [Planctomycetota bacterium]
MKDISNRNFGLLIAHVLPGFIALWGLQAVSPTVRVWLSAASSASDLPTVGGFLYVTLASVALGMAVGAIRWCVIDWLHHHTGLPRPTWDDSKLQQNLHAFDLLVEHHYRYYQFHSNTIVSLLIAYAAHRGSSGFDDSNGTLEFMLLALIAVFWATSRSNLHRYYTRVTALMNPEGDSLMSNGSHPKPATGSKPQTPKPTEAKKPAPSK